MLEMLGVIGPMFLVIVVGFLSGLVRRFREAGRHLNAFVFFFALPTFIYTAMVTAPPVPDYPIMAMLIPVIVTPVLSVLIYVLARWMTRSRVPAGAAPDALAAPTSFAATFGNVGYFGIPISIGVLGPEAGLVAGIVHTLHNILYMNGYPLVRTAVNTLRASDGKLGTVGELWRQIVWPILKRAVLLNPVMLFIALALLVVFTPLQMPAFFDDPVAMLGETAVPLALFCVGLALHPALEGVRSGGVPKAPIAVATLVKLIALPAATWLAILPFYDSIGPIWAGVLIIIAATPSSTTVFLFGEEYDGDGRLPAAILVASTALSLITLPLIAELLLV